MPLTQNLQSRAKKDNINLLVKSEKTENMRDSIHQHNLLGRQLEEFIQLEDVEQSDEDNNNFVHPKLIEEEKAKDKSCRDSRNR